MSVLSGKKILIGVTAGIAAYKSAALVRLFIKENAEVKVVMTPAAKDFVTPLTLATLSKNPVHSTFFDEESDDGVWTNHVDMGLWADIMIIAPATANTLSKMAAGNSDNLLIATYLSAKCPVYFAPAMDLDMYKHPSTKTSFDKLIRFGNKMIPAESGELASGLVGQGRMADPENILSFIKKDILGNLPLRNKNVLITGGPTYEAIDPVRFIGNHSSGKMGVQLATVAANLGANVTLVLGPSVLKVDHELITTVHVVSAQEMFDAVAAHYQDCDIAIASAAVADYRPQNVSDKKIKKKEDVFSVPLERTMDILNWMGEQKKNQFLVGFALETNDEEANAIKKIKKKNLDLIVLNSLNDKGAGFKNDTNKVSLINHKLEIKTFDLKTKLEVAQDIFNEINTLKNE